MAKENRMSKTRRKIEQGGSYDPFTSASGDPVKPMPGPEIMIGLVGPVGTDREVIFDLLTEELGRYSYNVNQVRISDLIDDLPDFKKMAAQVPGESEYQRIKKHMSAGTKLRNKTKRADILAMLAVGRIQAIRAECNLSINSSLSADDASRTPAQRNAFVLWSLKHPDEVKLLRRMYGTGFILISIHTPKDQRARDLAKRIAQSSPESGGEEKFLKDAYDLINIDEREESELGQFVTGTFPLADLFLEGGFRNSLKQQIERFFRGFFGYPYISPTRHELSMYRAKATSMRSADLSRQVGAVICTDDGDVISEGCNEIPKSGGGFYWEGDEGDARDFARGGDKAAEFESYISTQILSQLKEAGLLAGGANVDISEIQKEFIRSKKNPFDNTHVSSLLEFGRPVHAEMAAITNAARHGVSIRGGNLYCTTFPCHLCTRLIVSSGIRRVYYVEPYPKSQAEELYGDSISVDKDSTSDRKVVFRPFVGIAPRAFERIFKWDRKRKDAKGKVLKWGEIDAEPKIIRYINTYIALEHSTNTNLKKILLQAGVKFSNKTK